VKVAQGCSQLRSISLAECNIADASVIALGAAVDAQGFGYVSSSLSPIFSLLPLLFVCLLFFSCYHLESARLAYCRRITDSALHKLARGCPNVQTLDLSQCSDITPEGLRVALRTWTKLQTLRLRGFHLSNESIIDNRHPSLKVLNLSWCSNIVDAVLVDIASRCPALEHCDVTRCTKITDDAVRKLTEHCSNLRQLNLTGCKDVTQSLVHFLVRIGKLIHR
jgi:Leucine Rich repeat/Leucine Rich Repeat